MKTPKQTTLRPAPAASAFPSTKPAHYNAPGIIPPWNIIDSWGLDYYLGETVAYICRAGKKDPRTELEDLEKAQTCLAKRIELVRAKAQFK